MGDKGVNGEDEPCFEIEMLVSDIESLTDIFNTALFVDSLLNSIQVGSDIGVAMPIALTANHYPTSKTIKRHGGRHITEKAVATFNTVVALSPFMPCIVALAQITRKLNNHISCFFSRRLMKLSCQPKRNDTYSTLVLYSIPQM
jgi:hypothetical protein